MVSVQELLRVRVERDKAMFEYSEAVTRADQFTAGRALRLAAELTTLLDECSSQLAPAEAAA